MIKTSIEKLAEEIGYDIGASDDITQSKLLNGFCKGLYNSILDEHNFDLQLCYVAEKLTNKTKETLLKLTDFIKEQ